MPVLYRKLYRELWTIRSQALAIILVIVSGVGVCVMSLSTYHSLQSTRDNYYKHYQFADLFSNVKRAPLTLSNRISEIPGIATAWLRVVAQVNLQVPNFDDPITGLITSIPDNGKFLINRLHMVKGRYPNARRDNEIVISQSFANAHQLQPTDQLYAIINGRRRALRIVGIALSPEYIYQIAPGALFPDYLRFGVMWMATTPLSIAYDMNGAFNDVVVHLHRDANQRDVIDQLDQLLTRYGSLGAYGREDQLSNRFLREEFQQLQMMAVMFPVIFLGVALFLLNIVITRLIDSQRDIIAVLKAFGYSNLQVLSHYLQMVLIIVGSGILGGFALGMWLGQSMMGAYQQYYNFPSLSYIPELKMLFTVAAITLAATGIATSRSVIRAAMLAPAEAMRPQMPEKYHTTWLDKLQRRHTISPPTKMILRHLERKPVKSMLSILGMAMACAIMMVGNFQQDAINLMIHAQFKLAQKQDIELTFNEPVAKKTLNSLRSIPGVYYAEGSRSVPVRLRFEQRSYRTSLQGLDKDRKLLAVLDTQLQSISMPEDGVLVTEHLAKKLGFNQGDTISLEFLEGARKTKQLMVTGLSQQFLGLGAYMRLDTTNRLMAEGPAINNALLSIDKHYASDIYKRLRKMPQIAGINLRQSVLDSFYETMDRVILTFTLINAMLGGVIAFGVVYNTVRMALAERERELASLRVLGYRQTEVAYILLGEMAILTIVSLPVGFMIGIGLCQFMTDQLASDLYRIPLVLSPFTFSLSALVVSVSAVMSALIVWRRLRGLDMVEVLKTRE
jgi:putative ABC transport system permease protein